MPTRFTWNAENSGTSSKRRKVVPPGGEVLSRGQVALGEQQVALDESTVRETETVKDTKREKTPTARSSNVVHEIENAMLREEIKRLKCYKRETFYVQPDRWGR